MKARLTLKRELLSELTTEELTNVAGGNAATGMGFTCPIPRCIDPGLTDTSCNCCTASASC